MFILPLCGVLVRKIVTEMPAPAFFAFEGRTRDGFGNGEQVIQVERGVPAGIVFAMAGDGDLA